MSEIHACLACLATNETMHEMRGFGLQDAYQSLTGLDDVELEGLPAYLCWKCSALVSKFSNFRSNCLRAFNKLRFAYATEGKMTVKTVQRLDREDIRMPLVVEEVFFMFVDGKRTPRRPAERESWGAEAEIKRDTEVPLDDFDAVKCEVEYLEDFALLEEFSDDVIDKPGGGYVETNTSPGATEDGDERRSKEMCPAVSVTGGDGPLECAACRLRCRSRRLLRQHVLRAHAGRSVEQNRSTGVTADKKSKLSGVKDGATTPPSPKHEFINATETCLTQAEMLEVMLARKRSAKYKIAPHKCDMCYKSFLREQTFARHMLRHDAISGELQCDLCKIRHKTHAALVAHIKANHLYKFDCNLCSNVTYNRNTAVNHFNWHEGTRFKCTECDQTFLKRSSMLSHLRIKHPSQHVCGQCGASFVSPLGLVSHTRKMHLERPAVWNGPYCGECRVQFASRRAWVRHVLCAGGGHVGQREQIRNGCKQCGETFATPVELKRHSRVHQSRPCDAQRRALIDCEPQPCPQCGELISSLMEFYSHFRRAHPHETYPYKGKNSHICNVCGKGFRCRSILELHKHTHTETRPFRCGECPKAFYTALALRTHATAHSDTRPCVCEVCGMGFKQKGNLSRHMNVHTGSRRYECGACGRRYTCMHWTRHHIRTVHAGGARAAGAGARRVRTSAVSAPAGSVRVVQVSEVLGGDAGSSPG